MKGQSHQNRDGPSKDKKGQFDNILGENFDVHKGQSQMMGKEWLGMDKMANPFSTFAMQHFGS